VFLIKGLILASKRNRLKNAHHSHEPFSRKQNPRLSGLTRVHTPRGHGVRFGNSRTFPCLEKRLIFVCQTERGPLCPHGPRQCSGHFAETTNKKAKSRQGLDISFLGRLHSFRYVLSLLSAAAQTRRDRGVDSSPRPVTPLQASDSTYTYAVLTFDTGRAPYVRGSGRLQ